MVKPKPGSSSEGETDQTKMYMALKIIGKQRVVKTRQVEHTFAEKNILFCMDNNFIVKMFDYFVDSKSIYMLLEFINGGVVVYESSTWAQFLHLKIQCVSTMYLQIYNPNPKDKWSPLSSLHKKVVQLLLHGDLVDMYHKYFIFY